MATLCSPLKVFIPISIGFLRSGVGYYASALLKTRRFTYMGLCCSSRASWFF